MRGRQKAILRTALLTSTALVALSAPALAQDATWLANPANNVLTNGANWSTGSFPSFSTGSFGASAQTSLTSSALNTTVAGFTFLAGAPAYTFGFTGIGNLAFNGAGIVNQSAFAPMFNLNSVAPLSFRGSSSAGNATFNVASTGNLQFLDNSELGSATINNSNSATFDGGGVGQIVKGGTATINNLAGGGITFGIADLQNATLNNAATAMIVSNDGTTFGSATITNAGTLNIGFGASGGNARLISQAGGTTDISNLTATGTTLGSIEGAGTIALGAKNLAVGSNNLSTTFAGTIADGGTPGGVGGSLTKTGTGTLTLTGTNTYTGGTTLSGGTLNVGSAGALGAVGTIALLGGTLQYSAANQTDYSSRFSTGSQNFNIDTNGQNVTFATALTQPGSFLNKSGAGTLTLSAANTFTGTTTVSGGTLSVTGAGSLASTNVSVTGGTLLTDSDALANNAAVLLNSGILTASGTDTIGVLIQSGGTIQGTNIWTVTGGFAQSAGTTGGSVHINSATFKQTGGTIAAGTTITSAGAQLLQGGTIAGTLDGVGAATVTNGTTNLSGSIVNAAGITVNSGALLVNGSIGLASPTTVNGGLIGGNGTVGNLTMNGGTLSPGNSVGTITIQGNLVLTSAAIYMVETNGTTSDKIIVTGTATLGGNVSVTPLTRVSATTTYTILTSSGTTGTFAGVAVSNPALARAKLSYSGNDVLLTLDPGTLSGVLANNANANQRAVAGAIDTALLGGANLPSGFNALFNLTGDALLNGLSQASGAPATGTQTASFDAMRQFVGTMTDPFIDGRGGSTGAGAPAYASEDDAMAYAKAPRKAETAPFARAFTKAPSRNNDMYNPRWSVWAAGFGGSQTTDGVASVGSNNTTSSLFGVAAGADYRFSPNTIAGFALAGGGTNFRTANLGSGRSDLFQAGGFIRHNVGAAYITAAAAYGWQDVTTDRTVTIAGVDRLRAKFNTNTLTGRVESGIRFVSRFAGGIGLTPYAAGQATTVFLPSYAEAVVAGTNTFALAFASRDVTATRSELGLRSDKSFILDTAILTLRGRAAWAHNFNPDRSVNATFQSLPGASFTVNGAAAARDTALTSASAELRWLSGWSIAGTFEGEFSDRTRSYAGKGLARYEW